MRKLRQQGEPISADGVRLIDAELEDVAKKLSLRRLGELTTKTVVAKLCEMEKRRAMQEVAAQLSEAATGSENPDEAISEQLSRLMAREGDSDSTTKEIGDMQQIIDIIEWRASHPGQIRGMSTGFTQLDRFTDGLHSGLVTIAARPACGKSTILLNLCLNIAESLKDNGDNRHLWFGSFEQDTSEVQLRATASISGYPISDGGLTQQQMQVLGQSIARLRKLNITIDDRSGPPIEYVVSRIRRMHRERGLAAAFVDYAQLIRVSKSKGNKVDDLDKVSKSLQALGRELKIPIIAAAQLKRAEKQWNKKDQKWFTPPPSMDDVKGCGSFEEDSYGVWLIHRGEDGETSLILGKNRHGPRDKEIKMTYAAAIYRFAEK
jgi:replicative DNA helicase